MPYHLTSQELAFYKNLFSSGSNQQITQKSHHKFISAVNQLIAPFDFSGTVSTKGKPNLYEFVTSFMVYVNILNRPLIEKFLSVSILPTEQYENYLRDIAHKLTSAILNLFKQTHKEGTSQEFFNLLKETFYMGLTQAKELVEKNNLYDLYLQLIGTNYYLSFKNNFHRPANLKKYLLHTNLMLEVSQNLPVFKPFYETPHVTLATFSVGTMNTFAFDRIMEIKLYNALVLSASQQQNVLNYLAIFMNFLVVFSGLYNILTGASLVDYALTVIAGLIAWGTVIVAGSNKYSFIKNLTVTELKQLQEKISEQIKEIMALEDLSAQIEMLPNPKPSESVVIEGDLAYRFSALKLAAQPADNPARFLSNPLETMRAMFTLAKPIKKQIPAVEHNKDEANLPLGIDENDAGSSSKNNDNVRIKAFLRLIHFLKIRIYLKI